MFNVIDLIIIIICTTINLIYWPITIYKYFKLKKKYEKVVWELYLNNIEKKK